MAKQKKIIDIHDGGSHLIVIRSLDRSDVNPYRIYIVISPAVAPLRKRLLIKYADFMSCIHFIREFFLYGYDTMCYTEIMEHIRASTAP